MSTSAISIPDPGTHRSYCLMALAAAVAVVLVVTVSLVVAHIGSTTHSPARALSGGASVDCLVRAPGHTC